MKNVIQEKWKSGFVLLLLLAILSTWLFTGGTSKSDASVQEEMSIAVKGALLTQLELGSFNSADGTTANVTEEELQSAIQNYASKVDRYFSSSNPMGAEYKELNEDLLRNTFADVIDYQVGSGIDDFEIKSIVFSDDNTAEVECTITTWGIWVDEVEEGYVVISPVNCERMKLTMVLEDGMWKLKEISEDVLEVMDSLTDNGEAVMYAVSEDVETSAGLKNYNSFSEAFLAAESIRDSNFCED